MLKRFEKYSRKDIHDYFSPNTEFTPGAGYWGISGIIKIPNTLKDYIFLVTYGQKQANHEFEEGIDDNGVLTWQSQPSQKLNTPQIIDFINHNYLTDNIYLFLRKNKKDDYTYMGLLAYIEHDNQREKPVYFKWQVLDWSNNSSFENDYNIVLKENNAKYKYIVDNSEMEYTLNERLRKANK